MVGENLVEFFGKTVRDYDPEKGLQDPANFSYRFRLDWDLYEQDVKLTEWLEQAFTEERAREMTSLVIGAWDFECSTDAGEIAEAVIANAARLPNLRGLMVGDITYEEQEISWIMQCDQGPLLMAFQQLQEFRVRGGSGLRLSGLDHDSLQTLIVEAGGLSQQAVSDIATARLPNLTHLEVWLGTDDYGGDATLDDVKPLVERFPTLSYLGLRDSEMTDQIAKALLDWQWPTDLKVLDLSLGTIGDEGALALIENPNIRRLERLDLSHHYISKSTQAKLQALPVDVVLNDPQEADTWGGESHRYVAVSE